VTAAPGLVVQELTDGQQLQAIGDEWRALSARAVSALLFNDHAWISACWNQLCLAGLNGYVPRLHVLAVREAGRLVAVAPLMLETRRMPGLTLRVAHWVGEGPSDYGDLLLERLDPALVDALVVHLLHPRDGCHLVDLRECRGDSSVLPLLWSALSRHGNMPRSDEDSRCHQVPTAAGWTAYSLAQFSSKRRKDLRREWRKLATAGEFEWRMINDEVDLIGFVHACGDVQAAHVAAGEHRPGEFNHPLFGPFIASMVEHAARSGWLRMAMLRRNGQLVAYWLALAYRDRYYLYNTAHRAEVQPFGGGKLLMLFLLESLFTEALGPIDFLRGAEPYKEVLSNEFVVNRRLQAARRGLAGSAAARLWLDWIPRAALRPGRLHRQLVRLGSKGLLATAQELLTRRLPATRKGRA
jgi:CelD/BcsL family acetyltransferase involved in cellulose biosynthesis